VLDVGCGTGIAGALLAARGCDVLGVEIDARMAAIAREKGLEVEVASFEDWDDRGRRFDLLTCGQAWHWIDPAAGAAKAARVLTGGGRIGCFWNWGDQPPGVAERLAAVYRRVVPELEKRSAVLGHHEGRVDAAELGISKSRAFTDLEVLTFPWSRTYTTAEWIENVSTHSDHQALPPASLDALLVAVEEAIEELGGAFEMPYRTVLVTARRR
jgi:SAM-dependent methyltransferase